MIKYFGPDHGDEDEPVDEEEEEEEETDENRGAGENGGDNSAGNGDKPLSSSFVYDSDYSE
jgi:hypothetical protein